MLKDVKVFEGFGSGVDAITSLPLTLIFHFYFLTFFQFFFFYIIFHSIVEIESRFFNSQSQPFNTITLGILHLISIYLGKV